MAEQFWPGENVLGKHFTAERIAGEFEIVGVAGDIREKGANPKKWAQFYVPLAQGVEQSETLVVSSATSPRVLASAIRAAVLEIDRDQPIDVSNQFKTLEEIVSKNVATPRFEAYLVGSFAGIALLLAAVGIFGVISYSVKQRTREIGIRIALGASSRQITNSALRAMMPSVAFGLAAGWLATLWLTRFMSSELYGLSRTDAAANIVGITALCIVAALASYIPARRAAQVDPVVALRSE
jgi:ABC-type antimicrobial peptide transport system permease subunit